MIRKEIVNPKRIRRIPDGFGWVDHSLVRKGYLKERTREALALYLFLITVCDADGLSYYSDKTICGHLNFSDTELGLSRKELCNAELIAYKRPFYQVLTLPLRQEEKDNFKKVLDNVHIPKSVSPHTKTVSSLEDIIKSMTGGK